VIFLTLGRDRGGLSFGRDQDFSNHVGRDRWTDTI
jgi:hypothetical protein